MIQTTEKKHWQNGHQVRGRWFHTFIMSLFNYGVMISWGKNPNNQPLINRITFFKLI